MLTKYNIKTEVTATPRTGLSRFTFPKGQGNILLNLGEGLTNETGATVRFVSDTEIEGSKLMGTFCCLSDLFRDASKQGSEGKRILEKATRDERRRGSVGR